MPERYFMFECSIREGPLPLRLRYMFWVRKTILKGRFTSRLSPSIDRRGDQGPYSDIEGEFVINDFKPKPIWFRFG